MDQKKKTVRYTPSAQRRPRAIPADCVSAHFSLEHGAVFTPSREAFFRALEQAIAREKEKSNLRS